MLLYLILNLSGWTLALYYLYENSSKSLLEVYRHSRFPKRTQYRTKLKVSFGILKFIQEYNSWYWVIQKQRWKSRTISHLKIKHSRVTKMKVTQIVLKKYFVLMLILHEASKGRITDTQNSMTALKKTTNSPGPCFLPFAALQHRFIFDSGIRTEIPFLCCSVICEYLWIIKAKPFWSSALNPTFCYSLAIYSNSYFFLS